MILVAGDKTTYFPDVTVTGVALDGLLQLTQTIIEGGDGANRPLELAQRIELAQIHQSDRYLRLSHYPIASVTEVKIRKSPNPDWTILAPANYLLDVDGQLNFRSLNSQFGRYFNLQEAQVTYQAGFDFTSMTDLDVLQIKATAGRICSWIFANGVLGLASVSTQTSTTSDQKVYQGSSYLSLFLAPIRRYRARPV
jgi:hypothetical protein